MGLFLLNHLPTWLLGVLTVALACLIAVGGLLLVRRKVAPHVLIEHHEVAGSIYSVVGAMYGVLLAFVVVAVWQQLIDAEGTAQEEAGVLASLYHNANALPEPAAGTIRARVRAYAVSVKRDEWPELAWGRGSALTERAIDDLVAAYRSYKPTDTEETALYQDSLQLTNTLEQKRMARIYQAGTNVSETLWTVLLLGGAITVGYSYLFGVKTLRFQVLMTVGLAGLIAAILFVILATDYPFSGDLRVRPEAFETFLELHGGPAGGP